MTTAEVEKRYGIKVRPKWVVIVTPDGLLWKEGDGTWRPSS